MCTGCTWQTWPDPRFEHFFYLKNLKQNYRIRKMSEMSLNQQNIFNISSQLIHPTDINQVDTRNQK